MAYFSLKIISMVKNYARDAKHSSSLTLQCIPHTMTIPIQAPPLTLYQLHDVFFIQLKDYGYNEVFGRCNGGAVGKVVVADIVYDENCSLPRLPKYVLTRRLL